MSTITYPQPKIIVSNQSNKCRFCEKTWDEGEDVFYESTTAAICVDESCCNKQIKKRIDKRTKRSTNEQSVESDPQLIAAIKNRVEFFTVVKKILQTPEIAKQFESSNELSIFAATLISPLDLDVKK